MEIEKCKRGSSAKDILSQEKLKVPLEPGFLGFTFVPSFGRLPTQCYLADCTTFCNEVIAETKELEKPSAIGGENKGAGEAASCPNNKHKLFKLKEDKAKGGNMNGNGLFKAEFVLITDSDEDTKAILGNGYGHESSRILAASHVSSGDEWKGQGNVTQPPQHTDLPCSSASQQKHSQSYKINASYKTFAAIPTNTLLLEQKALDEQTKTELEVEDSALDTHSEMCSPAQLRQQTEELCAAIDQVLQEPLTRRRCNSSPGSLKNILDSNTGKASTASQRSAGRETKYANLYLTAPAVTETEKIYIPPFLQELKKAHLQRPCETKPGVIRPTTVKAKIIVKEEESVQPNPFKKYLEERSDLQTEQTAHPIVPIPENKALSSKELSSVRRKDKLPYQEDLSEGNFLDDESPHQRGHCPLRRDPRNSFAKLS
ncbi:muscular LMNA-interacting protein isoform X4 [Python bivittatus]|uniref:Muscular LMNA-interacting protein isoform X4 n=1 Tax=Python bivittatus TaxID=176946 RepID=A0A9F5J033_PYTBI|nr:muscular LMNA-interacting protein isoform X4 [Python bivittatus]